MKNTMLRMILAVAVVVLFAACGGGSSGDDSAPAPQTDETPAPAPTPDAPPTADAPEPPAADTTEAPAPAPEVPRTDYLTFAQGAIALSIAGPGAEHANFEHAVRIIDGDVTPFPFTGGTADIFTEFIYELPASTTFDRFAVPEILEVPSAFQTFTKEIEIHGSSEEPEDGYELLASATLETHATRGLVTEIPIVLEKPVRWVKLRLAGGIAMLEEEVSMDFSEIIGNGTQEVPEMVDHFTDVWKPVGPPIELVQDGPLVTGCYDGNSTLEGTVTGNILRARGVDPDDGVVSLFILSVLADGTLRGVASKNNGPFRLYTGPPADEGVTTDCSLPEEPVLGCGSIIHGINFDFDSAQIRPDSELVLQELFDGLQADSEASIVIEGHTSSEGSDAYNQGLSERRAQSVVDDLVRRGIEAGRISAVGKGEAEPIASNDDESGRSLNRRVEVECR